MHIMCVIKEVISFGIVRIPIFMLNRHANCIAVLLLELKLHPPLYSTHLP